MRETRSITITIATLLSLVLALAGAVTVAVRWSGADDRNAAGSRPEDGRPSVDLADSVSAYTSRFTPDHGFRAPSATERRTLAEGVGLLLDGRRDQAVRRLAQVDFAVRTVIDSGSGRRFAEVYDQAEQARAPRGWGRVYVGLGHRPRWSVQVPHPVADRATEQLGVRVLRSAPGGILIVAGAHRKAARGDAADVAHRRDTVFHAVCAELARRGIPGVQLHGFAAGSAPGYDVVASTGAGRSGRADGRRLADALRKRNVEVCRGWVRTCPLEGRENVQGRAAAAEDVPFLHIEFAPSVRGDDRLAAEAVAAIRTVTSRWAAAT
ncbi:hypothetical protein ACFY93_06170 [Streptomyces sp. NPDC008313]|uniref:hypothetical protein n=1 Tax=Streptomyces sp. NPDC008313 TaxID=3364826 RepID=UPI0036EE1F65